MQFYEPQCMQCIELSCFHLITCSSAAAADAAVILLSDLTNVSCLRFVFTSHAELVSK